MVETIVSSIVNKDIMVMSILENVLNAQNTVLSVIMNAMIMVALLPVPNVTNQDI
jgi:hypothetical protein